MKKISLFLLAAATVLGFTSCQEDKEPVYQVPTQFELNEPAMADQYIELNDNGTLELVTSQPDYGYSAVAKYSAEISLSEDFLNYEAITPTDEHQARMVFKQNDIALALCNLLGVDGEDSFKEMYPDGMPYMTVYFRAVCQLEGVGSSLIKSNVVSYNNIKGYLAVQTPGYIYLVGNPEGWSGPEASNAAHYAPWRLFEPDNAIGSHIYVGVFDLPAQPMFRFYTALTGWDADSYGSQVDDNPIDFELVDGSFTTTLIKGKGSFNFPNFGGGTVTIVVDMSDPNNMTFTMTEGESKPVISQYIYLVGSISGWMAPGTDNSEAYKDFTLVCNDESNVYTGSFAVTAGHVNFRFATELTDAGWDNPNQIGSQVEDADVPCSFTNGVYSGAYVSGKGNWAFDIDKDGLLTLTVDTNSQTVSFVFE